MINSRVNIARHGNINQEHGAFFAFLHNALHKFRMNNGFHGARGADHNICINQTFFQSVKRKSFSANFLGQFFSSGKGSVDDFEFFDAAVYKVHGSKFCHFPSPKEQGFILAHIIKNTLCQLHSRITDRHSTGSNSGFTAHTFCHRKSFMQQSID